MFSNVGLGGCIGANAGGPLGPTIGYPVAGLASILEYGVVDEYESVREAGECTASALDTTWPKLSADFG
jgi:hypothetical protein